MTPLIYFLLYTLVCALLVFGILLLTKAGPNVRTIVWILFSVIAVLYLINASALP